MVEIGFLPRHGMDRAANAKALNLPGPDRSGASGPQSLPRPRQCPKCGKAALVPPRRLRPTHQMTTLNADNT